VRVRLLALQLLAVRRLAMRLQVAPLLLVRLQVLRLPAMRLWVARLSSRRPVWCWRQTMTGCRLRRQACFVVRSGPLTRLRRLLTDLWTA